MNACVVYFSRTGNTKLMAQVLSKKTHAEMFDIASTKPEVVKNYDLVIVGTSVEGFRPTKEILAFAKDIQRAIREGHQTTCFASLKAWTFLPCNLCNL